MMKMTASLLWPCRSRIRPGSYHVYATIRLGVHSRNFRWTPTRRSPWSCATTSWAGTSSTCTKVSRGPVSFAGSFRSVMLRIVAPRGITRLK